MADNSEFKEVYNWWYFLAALGTLVALPLMHIVLGWIVFFFSH
ncbi:hypothetical protein QTP81_06535 [Alteromonas sp. ASW11-36]|uniref:Uncharacterized protein n=1 Tax=Alteromonas arenosi TaxID=3055817 RepID=A0ABT7SVM6_9ALTE|nr:hypothetical protein [Alteromonas sp. ASW11-36]MDM7860246.1 hypothetical protein [Alteromonas sp. ASW11-36]